MRPSIITGLLLSCLLVTAACGGGSDSEGHGLEANPDAGFPADGATGLDAGQPDAEVPAPADGGATDGGSTDAGHLDLPTARGWTFYGTAQGGPQRVLGVTADQGGNVWVAGGEEGLFLLRRGAESFERFTMDDGLRPFGYPWPAQGKYPAQGEITRTYLNVLSVAGGPPGTVFVGYGGMPVPEGISGCEDNWDGPAPDPNIFKSGDADRVTLTTDGLRVVHYDISTGRDLVRDEPRGREKICDVYRIVYDPGSASLWFGGNHGYAWGDPSYAGAPECFGQWGCSGVREHAHPLLNGYARDDSTEVAALTNYFWGLAVGPGGALWVGGHFRSQRCEAGMRGANFWDCDAAPHIDWWPDEVSAYAYPRQRTDDAVSGMSLGADGTLWIGSFHHGLARRGPDGSVSFITGGLVDRHVTAVQVDPLDGSVWVGANYGGLTRVRGEQLVPYHYGVFGVPLVTDAVPDIQVDTSGGRRRILVAFRKGAIGIYEGD